MVLKKCYFCKKKKPLKEFYKNKARIDGVMSNCKECSKKIAREKRERNLESHKARAHRYYQKNKNEINKKRKEWFAKNRYKLNAHKKVHYALKVGKIKKKPCKVCGALKVEAHHEDYNKPLDVIWLCHKHHKRKHLHISDFQGDTYPNGSSLWDVWKIINIHTGFLQRTRNKHPHKLTITVVNSK